METIQIITATACLFLSLWAVNALVAAYIQAVVSKQTKDLSLEVMFFCLFSVGFFLSLVL